MPESEKKRRSGRAKGEEHEAVEEKPTKSKKPVTREPEEHLRSPWGPLIWLLVPLFLCVAYGMATRGH